MMSKGRELANRLLQNIQTSLTLRAHIPYLDMLKELAQGGVTISTATLNTSSNFGSFDQALRSLLAMLHAANSVFMAAPEISPLPLTAIQQNLSGNIDLLIALLDQPVPAVLLDRLDTIHLASV